MVVVGTGSSGTRFIRKDYPIDEGTTAGTTKLADDWFLTPEDNSKVLSKDKAGIE